MIIIDLDVLKEEIEIKWNKLLLADINMLHLLRMRSRASEVRKYGKLKIGQPAADLH